MSDIDALVNRCEWYKRHAYFAADGDGPRKAKKLLGQIERLLADRRYAKVPHLVARIDRIMNTVPIGVRVGPQDRVRRTLGSGIYRVDCFRPWMAGFVCDVCSARGTDEGRDMLCHLYTCRGSYAYITCASHPIYEAFTLDGQLANRDWFRQPIRRPVRRPVPPQEQPRIYRTALNFVYSPRRS